MIQATTQRTLVIACGAIAHELIAVIKANTFDHVEVQCLPAAWHNHPDRIAPGVRAKCLAAKGKYARILLAYGDCGTGGALDKVVEEFGLERLPGAHCYSFFTGQDAFETMAEAQPGTFYLTDYLCDNFNRLVLQGLGINKYPELRDIYFAHYTRVLYLAQDKHGHATEKRMRLAQEAADSLSLPLEVHYTGLGPFSHALHAIHIKAA